MSELSDRYYSVCHTIDEACKNASRNRSEVTLVAVSKLHPIESIKEIAACGQKDFGENYIQEALKKIEEMPDLNWHVIGPIQSKKTKEIINKFDIIHTLASDSLLAELAKRIPENTTQKVLLQINLAREEQKSGLLIEDIPPFMEKALQVKQIDIAGLMCMPPFDIPAETTRAYFAQMRKLKEKMETYYGINLPHLSMGMSHDFEDAIKEGATIIRVGTDIFGVRENQ